MTSQTCYLHCSKCWIKNGIVTEGCQPYTVGRSGGTPPSCSKTCTSGTVI